jgi:hypothetical protein
MGWHAREGTFSGSVAHMLLTVTPHHVRVFPRQIWISLAKEDAPMFSEPTVHS